MFEEIISFESFALVCIFVALAAFLVWRQMRDAVEPLEDSRDRREEDANVTADFRSALAHYNDTEHLADMEFDRLRGKANLYELIANSNGVNTDEYRCRLNTGMTNYRAASMEPFCGEGKKP